MKTSEFASAGCFLKLMAHWKEAFSQFMQINSCQIFLYSTTNPRAFLANKNEG
jgi:hypothetical protein